MSEFKFNCPHCQQSLEAPEDMLGQTIECPSCNGSIQLPEPEAQPAPAPTSAPKKKIVTHRSKSSGNTKPCPYCGEHILRSAQKCKHCGEFLKGRHEVKTNVKQGALIGSVACFAIGIILMFISLWSFIIYSPLFLAAFILSIVAMSQKRVAGGLIMLLLTLVVPPVLFFGLGAVRSKDTLDEVSKALDEASAEIDRSLGVSTPSVSSKQADAEAKREKQAYMSRINLYDFEAKYYTDIFDDRKPGVSFKLKNTGTRTLNEVEVTVFFRDAAGNVIAEEDYHPVLVSEYSFGDSKPLKPNYIWQMERGKFYQAENVPTEWQEGNATAKITDIEFAD